MKCVLTLKNTIFLAENIFTYLTFTVDLDQKFPHMQKMTFLYNVCLLESQKLNFS